MTKNMGNADRAIRTLLAVLVAYLYFTGRVGGALGAILLVFAVAFAVSSFIGWCPAYQLFGFSTRKKSD